MAHDTHTPPGFDLHTQLNTHALEQDLQALNINTSVLALCRNEALDAGCSTFSCFERRLEREEVLL